MGKVSNEVSEETKKRKAEIEKKLQEEEQERIRKMKRKSSELAADASTPSKVPNLRAEDVTTTFDYGQVDFKEVFAANRPEKPAGDFNPNRGKSQQDKRKQAAGKPKQRTRGGGAWMTFNKK